MTAVGRNLLIHDWRWLALTLLRYGSLALLALFVLLRVGLAHHGDAYAYWSADLDHLYAGSAVGTVSYVYPPPFAQLIQPLRLLPWQAFLAVILTAEVAALAWMIGPLAALALILIGEPHLLEELLNANINLLLAAAIVAAFRYPSLWAFPILTKITPGIGLLWHLARREWRPALVAAGATAGLLALSIIVSPNAWADWLAFAQGTPNGLGLPPLWLRVGVAGAVVLLAGWRGVRWPVPLAVLLALPAPGTIHLTILVAMVPLAIADWKPSPETGTLWWALRYRLTRSGG